MKIMKEYSIKFVGNISSPTGSAGIRNEAMLLEKKPADVGGLLAEAAFTRLRKILPARR